MRSAPTFFAALSAILTETGCDPTGPVESRGYGDKAARHQANDYGTTLDSGSEWMVFEVSLGDVSLGHIFLAYDENDEPKPGTIVYATA